MFFMVFDENVKKSLDFKLIIQFREQRKEEKEEEKKRRKRSLMMHKWCSGIASKLSSKSYLSLF